MNIEEIIFLVEEENKKVGHPHTKITQMKMAVHKILRIRRKKEEKQKRIEMMRMLLQKRTNKRYTSEIDLSRNI
jgi:hypothetical protein